MDPKWRKANESQKLWNNWKRCVPQRCTTISLLYMYAVSRAYGKIFREQTANVLSQSYPHVPCDWNNWVQKLFRGFVLSVRHGNVAKFCFKEVWMNQWNMFTGRPFFWVSNFRFVAFCGSNFRPDDFGILCAKVEFFTNVSIPSIFCWHTFNLSWFAYHFPPRRPQSLKANGLGRSESLHGIVKLGNEKN